MSASRPPAKQPVRLKRRASAAPGGPRFNQREQQVQSQIIAGRDVRIENPSSDEALARLSKELSRVRATRVEELRAIEGEFGDPRDLDRCYVVPDLQDFNPPDAANDPGLIVSRQPAFSVVDEFLKRPGLDKEGNRCLFVLGDAGMGKTSLLLMLKFRHLTAFLPTDHDCVLMKLGPDTLARLDAVPDPAHTVLLLDSLDEDPEAHRSFNGADERLAELLPRVVRFHRTVITCRTQFFPETSRHLTTRAGHFVFGAYECPLKYLSLFNDDQVELYLRKHFQPGRVRRLLRFATAWLGEDPKLIEARQAAYAMESLRLRPLLLSRIDDFVTHEGQPGIDFANSYAVYHRLVDKWLMREAQKLQGLDLEEGWRVATRLALHLTRQGVRQISRDQLAGIEGLEKVLRFKIEARSLLSRTTDFQYQFAHATIQEFLVANAVLDAPAAFDVCGLPLSREAWRFVKDGQRLMGRPTLDLRGAVLAFGNPAVESVRVSFGLDLVPIPAGSFLMGSPKAEGGRDGDEGPPHEVTISREFWMATTPCTQAQWQAVMGNNPSYFKGDQRPVDSVTWDEATAFCQKLTDAAREAGVMPPGLVFRLPTEAEWEYACRAGTDSAFNDGSACTRPGGKDPALDKLGWYDQNSGGETHAVGEKAANVWGLCDMHGNVWEWCMDGKRQYTGEPQTDPVGPMGESAGRVVRGGACWDNARGCRSASRIAFEPGNRCWIRGFRLVAGQELEGGAREESGRARAATGREAGGAERRPEAPRRPA